MAGLEQEIVRAIDETPLLREPFDHVQLQGVFPDHVVRGMIDHLPDQRFFIDMTKAGGRQYNGELARSRVILLKGIIAGLPREQRRFWSGVAKALYAPSVTAAFKRKFADTLSARFGCPAEEARIFPYVILLRDLPGYGIAVHHDSWSKVITAQFYLPSDDERPYLGTDFFTRDDCGNDTHIKTIPFIRNSGYAFPVADNSWHGVSRIPPDERPRYSLMLTYYATPHMGKRIFLKWKDGNQVLRARTVAMARRLRGIGNGESRPRRR